jgi:NAD(P)H-hydrate repair Nnr-like enzyme with NAD(P)H-hydrate epimerase domain
MIVVTAAQMQAMDRKTIEEIGIPGRVLMENAAVMALSSPGTLLSRVSM